MLGTQVEPFLEFSDSEQVRLTNKACFEAAVSWATPSVYGINKLRRFNESGLGVHGTMLEAVRNVFVRNLQELEEMREMKGLPWNRLTHLTFGDDFNQALTEGVLPGTLTHLTFGRYFNQALTEGVLPGTLTHLTFGSDFNQALTEGVLPGTLTHLTFGDDFNQALTEGVLPGTLTHLTFGVTSIKH